MRRIALALLMSLGILRAQEEDCSKWIGNVFNSSMSFKTLDSKKAFERFIYKADFKSHDEAIAAGFSIGAFVYDVPIKIGGTWDGNSKQVWMNTHKEYSNTTEDFHTLEFEAVHQIDPGALDSYQKCLESKTQGLRLNVTRLGHTVYVSISCNWDTGDIPKIAIITPFQLKQVSGASALSIGATIPNTQGGIGGVFQMLGSEASIAITVKSSRNPSKAATAYKSISIEDDMLKSSAMIGEIRAFASGAPAYIGTLKLNGWMVCDGSSYKTSDYPELSEALGTQWGLPSNPTSGLFIIPNLSGQFIRGSRMGNDSSDPEKNRKVGTTQNESFHRHMHEIGLRIGDKSPNSYPTLHRNTQPPKDNDFSWQGGLTSTEGGEETRPINVAVLYCIFTGRKVK